MSGRDLETVIPQRAPAAQAGQHAARFLAHRGRARRRPRSSRPISRRSPPISRACSVRRSSGRACGSSSTARRCASRSTSIARCGRRSSSTCCRTRSSSRSKARFAVALRPTGDGSVELGARHGVGIARGRAAAPVRALPPRRRARAPHPRGLRHRPRAGPGAGAGCTAGTIASTASSAHGTHVHGRRAARPRAPARRALGAARPLAADRVGATPFVEEALRWLPDDRARRRREPVASRSRQAPAQPGASCRRRQRRHARVHRAAAAAACATSSGRRRRAALDRAPARAARSGADRRDDARLDGFGLLAALRADPATARHAGDHAVGARGRRGARRGARAGADDYLVKPFSARELVRAGHQSGGPRHAPVSRLRPRARTGSASAVAGPAVVNFLRGPGSRLRASRTRSSDDAWRPRDITGRAAARGDTGAPGTAVRPRCSARLRDRRAGSRTESAGRASIAATGELDDTFLEFSLPARARRAGERSRAS